MCRLTVWSDDYINSFYCRAAIHNLMTAASGIDRQEDGYGITDGITRVLNTTPYHLSPLSELKKIDYSRGIMAHVRSASALTELTVDENHPYMFPHWLAMHNGTVSPWTPPKVKNKQKEYPGTDSWFVLNQIADIPYPTDKDLGQWISGFDSSSAFVFVLYHFRDNSFTIVRGDRSRTLYFAEVGNGYVFNTSMIALDSLREFMSACCDIEVGETYEVPVNSVTRLNVGEQNMDISDLQYTLVPPKGVKLPKWFRR